MTSKINYNQSGVQYDLIDPFKIAAQKAAAKTKSNANYLGLQEYSPSRGESVFLIETKDGYLAHIEETLGTKNLVADAMYGITGKSYYDAIAQDTVAAIVNDLISLGALPISVAMHLAAGNSNWFADEKRVKDLVSGWQTACTQACAIWGGGETPTLQGIVESETVLLSGSAIGIIQKKERLFKGDIQDGDAIIFIASSGIHTNGLSLARKIAQELPEGYATPIGDGRMFGEALLDPSFIYVPIIKDIIEQNLTVHYTSHITGHGWRKIMRHPNNFIYEINELLPIPEVFNFIQKHSGLDDKEMFGTFNVGTGYALFVPQASAEAILKICKQHNFSALQAGMIKIGSEKKVVIKPKNIEFGSAELKVR